MSVRGESWQRPGRLPAAPSGGNFRWKSDPHHGTTWIGNHLLPATPSLIQLLRWSTRPAASKVTSPCGDLLWNDCMGVWSGYTGCRVQGVVVRRGPPIPATTPQAVASGSAGSSYGGLLVEPYRTRPAPPRSSTPPRWRAGGRPRRHEIQAMRRRHSPGTSRR